MKGVRAGLAGLAVVGAVVVLWWLTGGDDGDPDPAAGSAGSGEPTGPVTVLAAASLTEPFDELADRLAEQYPGLDVSLSFGPSSGLVEQAVAGAPADILATADSRTMDVAVEEGIVEGEPRVFARNTVALIVPAGNPGDVTALADLARPELRVAICDPQVPCGAAAEELLAGTGVTAEPDTLATDVKEALALVSLGEVDAALVYRTDATAAADVVETIAVPDSAAVVNDYPVAVLADAPNPAGARVVVDALTGEPGRTILRGAGFLEP